MPNEHKSYEKFRETLTPEQKSESVEKVIKALDRFINEGMAPYQAIDMPPSILEVGYGEAYRLYKTGLYEKAQKYFEFLMLLNPVETKYILGAAACLQMRKYYRAAIVGYETLAGFMPNSPLPYFYIYECCMQLNMFDEAREALEKVITLADSDPTEYAHMKEKAQVMLEGHQSLYTKGESKE